MVQKLINGHFDDLNINSWVTVIRKIYWPSFPYLQLKEEVESYERLKRSEFGELKNLRGLGHLLVSLRISRGMSQRDLAKKLEVHESQISRDERNEYHGVSIDRANKVLEALGVQLSTTVELEPI